MDETPWNLTPLDKDVSMRQAIIIAVVGVLVLSVGCAKRTTTAVADSTITDITPTYTPAPEPVYTPPPAYSTTPSPSDTYTAPVATSASTGERYTIKKGDTLYSIARNRYGDGKQWTRIAQANPGIDPQKLAVGQVIILP